MILSQLLLLLFMGYFLMKEYEDEYQEIINASQIDFTMKVFKDLEQEPVKWVKDENTDSGFRLVVTTNQSDTTGILNDSVEFISTVVSTNFSKDTF